MVGVAGIFGRSEIGSDQISDWIVRADNERTTVWEDDFASMIYSDHTATFEDYPINLDEGLLWVWGYAFSHNMGGNYVGKSGFLPNSSNREYIAEVLHQYGVKEGISRLNGQFFGILYDRTNRHVKFFTDRLGTRPIYYLRDGENLMISSSIQSFCTVSSSELEFDLGGLYEFLTFGRTLGTKTPIKGIEAFPPATISAFNIDNGSNTNDNYWRPVYNPVDKPLDYFTNELSSILEDFFSEVNAEDRSSGLLLSGGSDSRLLSDFLDERTTCYHMNDWVNTEASIAQEVAAANEMGFTLLERNEDHYEKVLSRGKDMSNFTSWFEQGHILGYDGIEFPDVMFTGQFSDSIIGGYHFPTRSVNIPLLDKSINTPYSRRVRSLRQYLDLWARGEFGRANSLPDFLIPPPTMNDVLSKNIHSGNGGIFNHGVEYPTILDMLVSHSFYPITNTFTFFFYESMNQSVPTISPFLDNRVVDLALSMPLKYHLRGKIVDKTIVARNDRLSAIEYPKTGLALYRNPYLHYFSRFLRQFRSESQDTYEKPYYRNTSPWVDHAELIRVNPFVIDLIESESELIDKLPFLDSDRISNLCTEHLEEENHRLELYALATLLSLPLTKKIGDGSLETSS